MGRSNYRTNYVINRLPDSRHVYNAHTEHDDRGVHQRGGAQARGVHSRLGGKQVGFVDGPRGGHISKRRQQQRGGYGGLSNAAAAALLPDDDVVFDTEKRSEQAGRGRPIYGAGGHKNWRSMQRRGGPGRTPPGLVLGKNVVSLWHRIGLRNGAKYDKMTLLRELVQRSAVKFVPFCYGTTGHNSHFFVEDSAAAVAIKELDKTIEMSDGHFLMITSDRSAPPPSLTLSEPMVAKIKEVMSARFIPEHCALNLRSFHTDKSFAGEAFYAPLFRTNVLTQVLTIITDHIPEVKAIDLSENKLTCLDAFVTFISKLSNLAILYLADNRIPDFRSVEKLKGLKLVELKLMGNPLVERLGSSYTATVRKLFPNLRILDDKELPKEIRFEDDEEGRALDMPASVPKLMTSPEAGALVLRFLEQYFLLYDSASRQGLLDAYHENAVMSLSATGSFENLKPYIENSRNLTRVSSDLRRQKLLHRGRLPIVSFLSGLPKTDHDATSFTLDLAFASKTMMTFTVTGMFKERDSKYSGIRHFNRCFIVVPQGSGFCIVNETLYICNATAFNSKKAFASASCTVSALVAKPAAVAAAPTLDLAAKQSLATAFAAKSGMNLEWSAKCLEENAWDFDKSAAVFFELKAAGKIPPEAFAQ